MNDHVKFDAVPDKSESQTLRTHEFSPTTKLEMWVSNCKFYGKAKAKLIQISFLEQSNEYLTEEEVNAGQTGWMCNHTEYFLAADRELADKAFDNRVSKGGFKVSDFVIYNFLDTLPDDKPPRHHGFTCPNCGSHRFGTYTYRAQFGSKYPPGTQVGHCNEHGNSGNGCEFTWNRNDKAAEDACMYAQTEQEWAAAYKTLKDYRG